MGSCSETRLLRAKKVSRRRRSVRRCLSNPPLLDDPLSQLHFTHNYCHSSFLFPYIHLVSLLPPGCPGASSWHWQKDLSCLPLSAGRHVYHGSAISLSPLTSAPEYSAGAVVCLPLHFNVWRFLRDRKPASLLPSDEHLGNQALEVFTSRLWSVN